jgi:C-terminal peptidase prc
MSFAKRRRLALILLIAFSLSCNTIYSAAGLITPTPVPTIPPPTRTATSTPEIAVLPTGTPPPNTSTASAPEPGYIPPECQGTAPATVPAETAVFEATELPSENPVIAADVQRRVFEELVRAIDETYVYPDFNDKDWPAIVETYRAKVKAGLDTETFYLEMSHLMAELGDEHSQFESPAQVKVSEAELSGQLDYVGIGVVHEPLIEKGRVTILLIFPDSPAAYSGLKVHDSILAVDGRPIVRDGEVYSREVRGPQCSAVVLTVQSPGEAPRLVTVIRNRIQNSYVIDARLAPTTDGKRIGYISLPTFFDETIVDQVRKALEDFGELDGLILDNRNNGGGSSIVVEPILGHFISGTLGKYVTRDGSTPFTIFADPIHNSDTVPLVVLVGKGTVSYGEIFSGVLKDSKRAKIVGQTTDGNVEVLYATDFEDGSRAWIASATFDPGVSHANWEQTGIVPDVEAYADWDTFTFETDPGVAAAVELLGHQQ